jgi:hypothetical protein
MKKIIAFAAVLAFISTTAIAAGPAKGTKVMSLSGGATLYVKGGDPIKDLNIHASYGQFMTDDILVAGTLNINAIDPEFNVGVGLHASYWKGLSDKLSFVGGLDFNIPVTPAFDAHAAISLGVVYWLSDTFGAALMDVTNLGSLKDFNADALHNSIQFGVVSFF